MRHELSGLLELTDEQLAAMEAHYALLLRWNRTINLTTVTELHEAAVRHYCESLFLASYLEGQTAVDIGSGAGFPGIPVAIYRPELRIDLVESHQRKAVFLREASRDLANIKVLAVRGESLTTQYDWMISRAVEPSAVLALRVSRRYALLLGAEDAAIIAADNRITLPWGHNRVLCIGENFLERST